MWDGELAGRHLLQGREDLPHAHGATHHHVEPVLLRQRDFHHLVERFDPQARGADAEVGGVGDQGIPDPELAVPGAVGGAGVLEAVTVFIGRKLEMEPTHRRVGENQVIHRGRAPIRMSSLEITRSFPLSGPLHHEETCLAELLRSRAISDENGLQRRGGGVLVVASHVCRSIDEAGPRGVPQPDPLSLPPGCAMSDQEAQ